MYRSKHGLYYADDWAEHGGPVLLPEGGSDTAALITMGLSAIGRPSNMGGLHHLALMLRGVRRVVIVLGERDQKASRRGTVKQCPKNCPGCPWCWPGGYGAADTATKLSKSLNRRVTWRLPPDDAKDVREWWQQFGNAERFLSRLEQGL